MKQLKLNIIALVFLLGLGGNATHAGLLRDRMAAPDAELALEDKAASGNVSLPQGCY